MGRGRFVVVEGIDFGGKTTQIERLGKRLNAKIEKFPNRNSRIGQIIDDHLTEKDLIRSIKAEHLLMAANRAEREPAIIQNLNAGFDVIADRFYASGVAYTSAKGIDETFFHSNDDLYNWAELADQAIIEPDITFYFKTEIGFKKSGHREIYEKETFQKKVSEQFERIKKEKKNWIEIEVDMYKDKIEELTNVLFQIIENYGKVEDSFRFNFF